MATKKIGIAYIPVLLSFTYKCDPEVDAGVVAKELVVSLLEDWEGITYGVDNADFDFNSLDWLRGSYMDQVQEIEVEDDEPTEDTQEPSSENG
jgi:hypothetical protein